MESRECDSITNDSDGKPDITCHDFYRREEHIDLRGDFKFVKEQIEAIMTKGKALPGFTMVDLHNNIFSFRQDTKKLRTAIHNLGNAALPKKEGTFRSTHIEPNRLLP